MRAFGRQQTLLVWCHDGIHSAICSNTLSESELLAKAADPYDPKCGTIHGFVKRNIVYCMAGSRRVPSLILNGTSHYRYSFKFKG